MKITKIRTLTMDAYRTNWCFVKVETDAGRRRSDQYAFDLRDLHKYLLSVELPENAADVKNRNRTLL